MEWMGVVVVTDSAAGEGGAVGEVRRCHREQRLDIHWLQFYMLYLQIHEYEFHL